MPKPGGGTAAPNLESLLAPPYVWRDRAAAALLAFTGGFVDTLGFIALFGLFPAHVTGNLVMAGAAAVGHGGGIVAKLLALPVFVGTVALVRLVGRRHGLHAARGLLLTEATLLAAFGVAGVAASPIRSSDEPLALVAGMIGVAAMAVQNVAGKEAFAALAPTTMMTGNVTQLTLDVVDWLKRAPDVDRWGLAARIGRTWPPLVLFAGGCAVGGAAYLNVGFACLAAPVTAVLIVAALERGRPDGWPGDPAGDAG